MSRSQAARVEVEESPASEPQASEPHARRVPFAQAIGIPLNVLLFLLLMVMAWGSWSGFFAHPVRVGVVAHKVLGNLAREREKASAS